MITKYVGGVARLLLIVTLIGLITPGPGPVTAQNTDCYRLQGGNKWVCDSGGEFEFQTGATLDVQSGATVTIATDVSMTAGSLTLTSGDVSADDLTVGDDLTVAGDIIWTPTTTETIGYDEQIDPTGSLHRITASAARGTDNIATGTAGAIVTLLNVGSNTITLTDTGTLKLAGNAALGQYDTLTVASDGTNWIELARANN